LLPSHDARDITQIEANVDGRCRQPDARAYQLILDLDLFGEDVCRCIPLDFDPRRNDAVSADHGCPCA
jgi:hypothetical protein